MPVLGQAPLVSEEVPLGRARLAGAPQALQRKLAQQRAEQRKTESAAEPKEAQAELPGVQGLESMQRQTQPRSQPLRFGILCHQTKA